MGKAKGSKKPKMPIGDLSMERLTQLLQVTNPLTGKPLCDLCKKDLCTVQALRSGRNAAIAMFI